MDEGLEETMDEGLEEPMDEGLEELMEWENQLDSGEGTLGLGPAQK
jgi:hypothetical protein